MSVKSINNFLNMGGLRIKKQEKWVRNSKETLQALLNSNITKELNKKKYKTQHFSYNFIDMNFINHIELIIFKKGKETYAVMGSSTQYHSIAKQTLINKLNSAKSWIEAMKTGIIQQIDSRDLKELKKIMKKNKLENLAA